MEELTSHRQVINMTIAKNRKHCFFFTFSTPYFVSVSGEKNLIQLRYSKHNYKATAVHDCTLLSPKPTQAS